MQMPKTNIVENRDNGEDEFLRLFWAGELLPAPRSEMIFLESEDAFDSLTISSFAGNEPEIIPDSLGSFDLFWSVIYNPLWIV